MDTSGLPGAELIEQGLQDLAAGIESDAGLLECFEQIAAELYRYPAIDPASFRRAVERAVRAFRQMS